METAIIVWLYVVGLGITWTLIHDVTHKKHGFAIALLWPVSIPLILALRWTGLLSRFLAWADRHEI